VSNKGTAAVGAGAGLLLAAILLGVRFFTMNPDSFEGAVITRDPDPIRQLPIGDAEITLMAGPATYSVRSDASGYFIVHLQRRVRRGEPITIRFQHPDYQSMEMHETAENKLYMAELLSVPHAAPHPERPDVNIAHVVAEYSVTTTNTVNIGSAWKTFTVPNTPNFPCGGARPCSPDGRWRATIGSAVLDAGQGNSFQNARVSCIAGPCPFTRIVNTDLSHETRTLHVSALNWSTPTTFLLEAEVFKPLANNVIRRSYPVIFERALTFTLPEPAEGVSIEAEVNGTLIVFPLGPTLYLSWADCQVVVNKDQTRVYRCDLKPGYRFQTNLSAAAGN